MGFVGLHCGVRVVVRPRVVLAPPQCHGKLVEPMLSPKLVVPVGVVVSSAVGGGGITVMVAVVCGQGLVVGVGVLVAEARAAVHRADAVAVRGLALGRGFALGFWI